MIKPEFIPRPDEPTDEYYETRLDNIHQALIFSVNLSAITDYASLGLSGSAIAAILGVSHNLVTTNAKMKMAYNKGRAILKQSVAIEALKRMSTSDSILCKWMDGLKTAVEEADTIADANDLNQAVNISVSYPARPKTE